MEGVKKMNQWDKDFRDAMAGIANYYTVPQVVPHVLHIGGHIGQEASVYNELGMLATYCEPVPEFAEVIRARGLAHRVLQCAVGKSGIVTMQVNGQESSTMGKKKDSQQPWGEIEVLSVPLWLLQLQRRWNVLVIDAQGSTMEILRSGHVIHFDWIIAEASVAPKYTGEEPLSTVKKFLQQTGFKEWEVIQHGDKDIFDLIFANKKKGS